ncbi:hypothetical protein CQ054_21315 [Ochrobactrum sp. MYb29]|nr:hypothetical protein CQ054_21315 [Ochrobactrum sp. MYb29]
MSGRTHKAVASPYPFRISVKKNSGVVDHWSAKAGLLLYQKEQAYPIFGFSYAESYEQAEALAKFECIEHLWGCPAFYSENELYDPVQIYSVSAHTALGTMKRGELLIGAYSNGRRRNATGLALGSFNYDPVQHATHEIFERHLCALWWDRQEVFLRPHLLELSENSIKGVLTYNTLCGCLAVSFKVRKFPSIVCFGSAFRTSKDKAIEHANAEFQMLRMALEEKNIKSPRHSRLIETSFVIDTFQRIRGLLVNAHCRGPVELPECSYAILHAGYGYQLVRVFSPEALDITQKYTGMRSPFL